MYTILDFNIYIVNITVWLTLTVGQFTPIARAIEHGTSCYSGWTWCPSFKIDHRKLYEFSIWILSTGSDMINYLGFYAYNTEGKDIKGALAIANPYFKSGGNDPRRWFRWNGFVLPSNTPASSNNPYKPQHDIPSYFSNGEDWKWPPNAAFTRLRFGSCYGDGDNSGITYFALPQVIESDLLL